MMGKRSRSGAEPALAAFFSASRAGDGEGNWLNLNVSRVAARQNVGLGVQL